MRTIIIADDAQPRLARGVRMQIDPATGKGVVLFPEGILELNETAQEIITRCDGHTVSEIVQRLVEEYEVDLEILAADVRETLGDLHRHKLVEFA
jgi:pyrroloquinoline quinone biosynthesis protein D